MTNDAPIRRDDELEVIAQLRAQIRMTPLAQTRRSLRSRRVGVPVIAGAGATAVLALAALLIVLLTNATAPSAAYALTLHDNGTVTITLRDEQARPALNARLAAAGIAVRVVPVVHGCDAPVRIIGRNHEPSRAAHTLQAARLIGDSGTGRHPASLGATVSETILIPINPGRTFVLAESRGGLLNAGHTVLDPVPACVGDTPSQAPAGWGG